jgi:hypothetical protein
MSRVFGAALLNVILAALPATAAAQEISFSFNPPLDHPLTQRLHRTRTLRTGTRPVSIEEVDLTLQIRVQSTVAGYLLVSTPLAVRTTRNGAPYTDPRFAQLKGLTVVTEVDHDGRLIAVRGLDRLARRLRRLPGVPVMSEAALVQQEVAQWYDRFGAFAGRQVGLGELWLSQQPYPLPDGHRGSLWTATRFDRLVPCGTQTCLAIDYVASTDLDDLTDAVADADPRRSLRPARSPQSVAIAGHGRRLVDPTTMLIYAETREHTVRLRRRLPGKPPVSMLFNERIEVSWH